MFLFPTYIHIEYMFHTYIQVRRSAGGTLDCLRIFIYTSALKFGNMLFVHWVLTRHAR